MRRAVLALLLVLPAAGCGSGDEETLTVLAAASLADAFGDLAETFEEEHPGTDVRLVLGSSTMLAQQAVDGAPGGVLATADEASMRVAEDGDALRDGAVAFATNALVLVVPADNPAGVASIDDLDDAGVEWVTCAPTAPCGALAADLLASSGVARSAASEEVDVRAVLARVVAGEADAGLVYATEAVSAGDQVEVVERTSIRTDYLVAPLHGDSGETQDLASEFVTFVRSDAAREALDDAGFEAVVGE